MIFLLSYYMRVVYYFKFTNKTKSRKLSEIVIKELERGKIPGGVVSTESTEIINTKLKYYYVMITYPDYCASSPDFNLWDLNDQFDDLNENYVGFAVFKE